MCGCCFHGDKSDLDKDANKWHDKRKEMRFTSAQGGPLLLALTSEITHAVDSKRNKTNHRRSCQLCASLTEHGEVDHVLPVSRRKGGVLADVGGLVGQLQVGEHDGGVLQRGGAVANRRLLEAHPLLEGRQDGHAERRVGDGHVLLGAVEELLPGDLGDLDGRVAVAEDAAQFHL